MNFFEIVLTAIGLSMDAFAVSICKGLNNKKVALKECLLVGLYFGFFQAFMPILGYFLGSYLKELITIIDHWVVLVLLSAIGLNMILEGSDSGKVYFNVNINFKTMFFAAIATSIDALAVGISFAFLEVNIIPSVLTIGLVTFSFSVIGVKIGSIFGNKYERKSQIVGGIILILIGIKILFEHLNIL